MEQTIPRSPAPSSIYAHPMVGQPTSGARLRHDHDGGVGSRASAPPQAVARRPMGEGQPSTAVDRRVEAVEQPPLAMVPVERPPLAMVLG